ncbi:arylamine N-acetyltransferase [Paractinoplanes rishiriensis]|uniref:HTH lacI-type domain-containing protein n=1 Tax=Paractinoplanes rishiriensis TaxID=1050105 RepID=A0A919JXM7_9ACTN|nr:arylamine N-acetyltransferase [Actinoplanes rishiriensis]GIE95387.1 hypothetical protein Ari01nite_28520 [Actinoplanes rishiriensis]
MKSHATLKTVAEAAGVSTAAVSYAFNRPDRLSAQAREHILAVADALGYAGPDATARSLRTRRAGAIGAVFTVGLPYAFRDPYMTEMLAGLTEITEETRTGLTLIPYESTDVTAVQRAVIDGAVADGLGDDHPAVRALAARKIPLVQSSATAAGRCVVIDDREGGRRIGRHLAGLGHTEVVVVVAYPTTPGQVVPEVDEAKLYPYSRLRLEGIREAVGAVRVVSAGRNAEESGRVAALAALAGTPRPTAIAADSDVLAAGVLSVVGRDLAVTGFDDAPFAAAAGLTTIRQPIREKGRLMGRMLLDPTFTAERVELPTSLIVRASSAPAGTPAPDEWGVDRLDLDAYLLRVGITGPLRADEDTLTALHRAHIAAIPFENLDVILGRGISVDLDDVQAKLVTRHRGGYCYEHGILFAAVLERAGFRVDRLLARTGDPAEHPRPRSHLVLRVRAGDRDWLADVGFGSGLLTPLPLAATGPQRQGAWQYELVPGRDGAWRLREHDGTGWRTIQTFTTEPQHLVDIEVANENTSTSPGSPFTQRPIVVRKDETAVRRLLGREYTLDRPGQPAITRTVGDDLGECLAGLGLVLTAEEVAALCGWQ